jgi:hypothetical protein
MNHDLFKVTRDAEVFTADTTGLLKKLVNSNAEIEKGVLTIDNDGNLKINGSNLILSSGAIQRRSIAESNDGFQVSPNGYLTMGGLQVLPSGVLTTNQNVTACNATISKKKERKSYAGLVEQLQRWGAHCSPSPRMLRERQ